jgi:hypothetical protein
VVVTQPATVTVCPTWEGSEEITVLGMAGV